MVVEKVINNNVVTAIDGSRQEVVLMGKGIGFQARAGQDIDKAKIEKKFILSDKKETGRFSELVQDIPLEHLDVSIDIIEYAKQVLARRLSTSIYISLTDHINIVLERYKSGVVYENPLLQEVRSFYPSEYLIGEYAVTLIERNMQVSLPVDEAASIAMHFVNAEYHTAMSDTMKITTLIRQIINLVDRELDVKLDELGLDYSRFVTHLKYLAYRVFSNTSLKKHEDEFLDMVRCLYPEEFAIGEKIASFIKEEYGHEISREETVNLTIHIRRIQPDADKE